MVQPQPDKLVTSDRQIYHQTLWENSPTAQALCQPDGIILDANQAYADLIGRTLLETLGLNVWRITPETYHYRRQVYQSSLEKTGKFTAEHQYLDSNRRGISVRLSGVAINLDATNLILLSAEKISSRDLGESHVTGAIPILQHILDSLPQYIFWKDCDSVYLGCNQKFAEAGGLASTAEIVGKTDYDLPWKPEETAWFRECDRRVIDSGIAEYNILESQLQADGRERWLKTNKIPLRDLHGNLIGILGTYEDISDRLELEQQLKEQTKTLEALVAKRTAELATNKVRLEKLAVNLPGAIYQFKIDSEGRISFPYISSGCEELFGLTPAAIMADSNCIMSLMHPSDRPNFERVVAASARTLQPKKWEGRVILSSGQIKWIQSVSRPEAQEDGSIIWDGVTVDISDRVSAEQELRKSQSLLQLVFDTLPQCVYWKDKNFKYLGCNQKFARDVGLDLPEQVIGKSDTDLAWHKYAHLYRAEDDLIMAGGVPKINKEETRISDTGQISWLKSNKIALKNDQGEVIGLFGSYEDITASKRKQEELETTRDFLEKAINSIDKPIFIKNTEHRWVLVNDAYCKFLGYPKDELINKSERDFFSPDEADIYWAKDELVMVTGEREIDEEPYTDAEGNNKIIITQKSCFQDLNGNTFLVGMIMDIVDYPSES